MCETAELATALHFTTGMPIAQVSKPRGVMGLAILILALFPVVYVFAPRAAFVALGVAIVLIYRGRARRG